MMLCRSMILTGLFIGTLQISLLFTKTVNTVRSFQPQLVSKTTTTKNPDGLWSGKKLIPRSIGIMEGSSSSSSEPQTKKALDPKVCAAFTIQTCSSTACTKKKRALEIDDDLAIYSGLYVRKEEAGATAVNVEESPCLGNCQRAPCVGIEHEDYYGMVSLEGMTDAEFQTSIFQNVATEEDMDRIWDCVENAIQVMANMDDDEE